MTEPNELQTLLDFLSEISLKEIKVPMHLKIPYWPSIAGSIEIELGRRSYYTAIKSPETGLLRIVRNDKKTQDITFTVEQGGTFHASFSGQNSTPDSSGTKGREDLERIRALLIFHQFKEEIYKKITEKLKADLPAHDKVARLVAEALEPFNRK